MDMNWVVMVIWWLYYGYICRVYELTTGLQLVPMFLAWSAKRWCKSGGSEQNRPLDGFSRLFSRLKARFLFLSHVSILGGFPTNSGKAGLFLLVIGSIETSRFQYRVIVAFIEVPDKPSFSDTPKYSNRKHTHDKGFIHHICIKIIVSTDTYIIVST